MSEAPTRTTLDPAQLRHWASITCDRCATSLTLSSATKMDLDPHLLRSALALGWSISDASALGLGGPRERRGLAHDLCGGCVALKNPSNPAR